MTSHQRRFAWEPNSPLLRFSAGGIGILHQRRRPMKRLASASILFALMTTVASAQAPQQAAPAAPRQNAGPAAQIHTSLPAESATVTHWYKQNVYDPADNKIGEIMDVLVDRDGKITALIVGHRGVRARGQPGRHR